MVQTYEALFACNSDILYIGLMSWTKRYIRSSNGCHLKTIDLLLKLLHQIISTTWCFRLYQKNGWRIVYLFSGSPINTFEFLRPVVEGLGYSVPQREISVKTAMQISWFMWGMYILLFPLLQKSWIPQPFILPAEVYKVSLLDKLRIFTQNPW